MAAFRLLLGSVARGEVEATDEIVDWLETGLDHALDDYAADGHKTMPKASIGGGQ